MPKVYKISDEELKEITKGRKANKEKNADKRLEVLEMRAKGIKYSAIAAKTGFNESYASQLVVKYVKECIQAILGKKREANRRNMSFVMNGKRSLAKSRKTLKSGKIYFPRWMSGWMSLKMRFNMWHILFQRLNGGKVYWVFG